MLAFLEFFKPATMQLLSLSSASYTPSLWLVPPSITSCAPSPGPWSPYMLVVAYSALACTGLRALWGQEALVFSITSPVPQAVPGLSQAVTGVGC